MNMNEKQSLNVDFNELLPGESMPIGNQSVMIRPLGFMKLAGIIKQVKGLLKIFEEQEVTWDNFQSPEKFVALAEIIMINAPEILSEASNIELADLGQLPLDIILQILDKVVEVNMKSKDALVGNFKSLVKRLGLQLEEKDKSTEPLKN